MNIAISFCGEGYGHVVRAASISKKLMKNNKLFFWSPNEVKSFFSEIYPFVDKYNFSNVPKLKLYKKNNKVNIIKTFYSALVALYTKDKYIKEISEDFKKKKIDILISDYEPFTAQAAHKLGIPVIYFNHPSIILKYPYFNHNYFLAKTTAYFMMPNIKNSNHIITSFYNGDIGPIIRNEIKNLQTSEEDFILVYLKKSLESTIKPILDNFKEINFKFFWGNNQDFINALSKCKGVIGAGGHQLISECLYLKKPIFCIPEENQYEQQLNTDMLIKTGWGLKSDKKELKKNLKYFIDNIDLFPLNNSTKEIFCFNDNTDKIIDLVKQIGLKNKVEDFNHRLHR